MSGMSAGAVRQFRRVPQVGVVVVGHGNFAAQMVETLITVVGDLDGVEGIACRLDAPRSAIDEALREVIARVDRGGGVIILTDMLGDTASNASVEFARERDDVEVVCGVNMPMLMKLVTARSGTTAAELAAFIRRYGQEHIRWPTGDAAR